MEPIKLSDDKLNGTAFRRYVLGLNIFEVNHIDVPLENDPRIILFETIAKTHPSSAYVGSIALDDITDDDIWCPFEDGDTNVVRTDIGIFNGRFCPAGPNYPKAYFFPDAKKFFQEVKLDDLEYLIRCDALGLCILPKIASNVSVLQALQEPYISETQWLNLLLSVYRTIILSSGDGWYIHALAGDKEQFNMLDAAIEKASESIKLANWYRENEGNFHWDSSEEALLLNIT